MRTPLLPLAKLGLGALLLTGCMQPPPPSSIEDTAQLPSGNPAPTPEPLASNNAPVGKAKKTTPPVTDDWSKPTPDLVGNPSPDKVPAPEKPPAAKKKPKVAKTSTPKTTPTVDKADETERDRQIVDSPPAPSTSASAADSDSDSDFDNLEIVDAGIKRKLTVLRVVANRTDSNLLSVVAGLKNKTAHSLEVEVQTIYKDKSSASLSGGSGSWIPIRLKPHESTDYRSVALSPDAVDFLVRIRLPKQPPDNP